MEPLHSFPPVWERTARILILGSMPGRCSLDVGRYYAHPRNAFWPILGRLLGFEPRMPYEKRLAALTAAGVALWDVLGSCRREGSGDASIIETSIEVNPLGQLLGELPELRVVCFNGRKAEQAYLRYVMPTLTSDRQSLLRIRLPSTSPAYAGMSCEEKLIVWQQVRDFLPGEAP